MVLSRLQSVKKIKPNPMRQLILVGLALIGLAVGYGIGFVLKPSLQTTAKSTSPAPFDEKSARPAPSTAMPEKPQIPPPNVVLPEDVRMDAAAPVLAYEEALPKEIVVTVEPLGPARRAPPPSEPKAKSPESAKAPQLAAPKKTELAAKPAIRETVAPTPIPRTWQRHAVAAKPDGSPMVAIVFDDLGIDKARTRRAVALPGPMSMSFLTYATRLTDQTAAARAAGHEIWMHVPMEPSSTTVDPGPNVLKTGLSRSELLTNLRWNLDQFGGYVGINNHMGSRFTADPTGMQWVMVELKARGLAFLDSVTSGASQGSRAAAAAGVDFATRNVFIDHEDDIETIRKQLARIEALAKKQGHAIAIGHPREKTLAAITPWLVTLADRGFQLVPVSALLNRADADVASRSTDSDN